MNIDKLRIELAKPAYEGLSDQAATDLLNAETISLVSPRLVNERTIMAEVGATAGLAIIEALEGATHPLVKKAAEWLKPNQEGIDVGHPDTRAQIDAIVPSVLTQNQADALKGLAETQVSRATEIGIGLVRVGYVTKARI